MKPYELARFIYNRSAKHYGTQDPTPWDKLQPSIKRIMIDIASDILGFIKNNPDIESFK